MFFVRKFLLFWLLCVSVSYAGDPEDVHTDFLRAYHGGKYDQAHELLRTTFMDEDTIQVWEERLHLQSDLPACSFLEHSTNGTRALALLRIGRMEEAKSEFAEDSISLLGRSTLSFWQSDLKQARDYLLKALVKDPDDAELLFLGASIVETDAEALTYFQKFLQQKSEDPLKILSAKQAIDFLEKTRGKQLNIATLDQRVEKIDSDFHQGRLLIEGKIDEKKVKLLVDSGAAGLSLEDRDWEPQLVSELMMIGFGQDKISYGKRVVFDRFSAGNFSLQNAVAALSPSLHAGDVDGVAGSVVFSDYIVLLPMQSGKDVLLFSATDDNPLDQIKKMGMHFETSVTVPFYLINRMMIVKGRVKRSQEDMDILIDTGAHRSVVSIPTAERYARIDYRRSRPGQPTPQLFGMGGSVLDIKIADNVEVQIGSIKRNFNEMVALNLAEINEAMELDLDLILGQDFLSGYSLLIDYHNRTLTLLR
jgi:tetratricopeptide (TPR) repeat protein